MIFKLMKYLSVLIIILLLCLPTINVLGSETKMSVLDILMADGNDETFKDYAAKYFAADLFGLDVEEYTGFLNALNLPITTGTFEAKTMIFNGFIGISLITLAIYGLVSLIGAIKTIVSTCIGGSIILSTEEKYNRAFSTGYGEYYFDKEAKEKALPNKRSIKKFIGNLILFIVLVCLISYFPVSLYLSLIKDEAISIATFIPILFITCVILLIAGLISSYIYGKKYSGTLIGCSIIKSNRF